MYRDRINCQLCKHGREKIQRAITHPLSFQCSIDPEPNKGASSNESVCEIAIPINDGQKPLAVLDVIAKEGQRLGDQDMILIHDLANLAKNLIINARDHWKIVQEKLTLDGILRHLRPFVPQTVQRIVEKNPSAPLFEKREIDVSILFLDVAGYTRISKSLTQEMVNFIIEKYFSASLTRFMITGGTLTKQPVTDSWLFFKGMREKMHLTPHTPPWISTAEQGKSTKNWKVVSRRLM